MLAAAAAVKQAFSRGDELVTRPTATASTSNNEHVSPPMNGVQVYIRLAIGLHSFVTDASIQECMVWSSVDDDDEGRINFSAALSPKSLRLQGHVTISLNSEVT